MCVSVCAHVFVCVRLRARACVRVCDGVLYARVSALCVCAQATRTCVCCVVCVCVCVCVVVRVCAVSYTHLTLPTTAEV